MHGSADCEIGDGDGDGDEHLNEDRDPVVLRVQLVNYLFARKHRAHKRNLPVIFWSGCSVFSTTCIRGHSTLALVQWWPQLESENTAQRGTNARLGKSLQTVNCTTASESEWPQPT